MIHRDSPYASRPPKQQPPSSHVSSSGGTTPREPSKLMTYLERTRRAVPTPGKQGGHGALWETSYRQHPIDT